MKLLKILTLLAVTGVGVTLFVVSPVEAGAPTFEAITEEYVKEEPIYIKISEKANEKIEEETFISVYAEEETTIKESEEETTVVNDTLIEELNTTSTQEEVSLEVIEETYPVIEEEVTIVETETETIEESVEYISTWENIVYKDGLSEDTYNYNSLEDAKNSIVINSLSDEDAKKIAKMNKKKFNAEIDNLIFLINSYREENGLKVLDVDKKLVLAACHRAAESAYSNWNMTGYLDGNKHHIRPNYETAKSICNVYGIEGNFGENYARYFDTAQDTLVGWQESEAHNNLLLSDNFSSIGVGIAIAENGDYYWIAIFN